MKIKEGMQADFDAAEERNSHDAYGACGYRYLNKWANLMEVRMEKGEAIKDMAQATSNEADTEGITGFMYGLAVQTLAHFWQHGEELRKWHNKEYDYNGDGTVNPAVITIG